MNLEQLKEEWAKDCEVDDIELDKSSLEVPKLHAKYSALLTSKISVSYTHLTLPTLLLV